MIRKVAAFVLLFITCYGELTENYEVEIDALLNEEDSTGEQAFRDLAEMADAGLNDMEEIEHFDDEEEYVDEAEESGEFDAHVETLDDSTPAPAAVILPQEGDIMEDSPALVELMTEEDERALVADTGAGYGKFGECEEAFKIIKKRITIFVYIDICPSKDQCDVVKGWSKNLTRYLRNRYGLTCVFRFILKKTCKSYFVHPFRDVVFLEDTDNDKQLEDKYEDLFPKLPADSEEYNFAVNFFRYGSGNGAAAKQIIDAEKKSYITKLFNFYICPEKGPCKYNKKYNGGHKLLSLVNIVAYSRLRIVSKFACKTVNNAVPIEFYQGHKHKCVCRCPATHFFKHGKCIRKRKRCKCKWLNKCFVYEIKSHLQQCKLKNWYKKLLIAPIPMPFDNYVGFKKNKFDKANGVMARKAPCVQLEVDGVVVDYTWKYFQNNRGKIFNNIEITKPGRYKIILRAFDYGPEPAICKTVLVVRDENRPDSTKPCPKKDIFGVGSAKAKCDVYSKENYKKGRKLMRDFKKWLDNRKNDKCGLNAEKDADCLKRPNKYTRWTFCDPVPWKKDLKNFNHPDKCFQVFSDDTNWMKKFVKDNLLSDGKCKYPLPGRPKYCKKCCQVYHQFSELYSPFKCKWRKGKPTPQKCCPGGKCGFKQCLKADGHTFFKADIGIKPEIKKETKKIINKLFPDNGYNKDSEIHYVLPKSCTTYGAPNCQVKSKIRKLFDETRMYLTPFIQNQIFNDPNNNKPGAENLVKWRYKIESGSWVDYAKGPKETFDKLKTCITLEAWSACGRICKFRFCIYVHKHTDLDICEDFAENSFYQSTRYHTKEADTEFCNHPESDFGELTFEFNPAARIEHVAKKHEAKHKFIRMKCWARFGGKDNSEVKVVDWDKTDRFLHRYAVNLVRNPTTRSKTPLRWRCEIKYKPYGRPVKTKVCKHKFNFCDCEEPGFDCVWGKCQKKCKNTKLYKRPNQACGGSQLRWNYKAKKSILDETTYECCQECGEGAVCKSIIPGVYYNTICSCRVKGKDKDVLPGPYRKKLNIEPRSEPRPAKGQEPEPVIGVLEEAVNAVPYYYYVALLGAMVAGVALIAVGRASRTVTDENAVYQPLMM